MPAVQPDPFYEIFGGDFQPQPSITLARTLTGPHVYLVIAPKPIRYPNGWSSVKYIGHTDTPKTRFANHEQIRLEDRLSVMPLQPLLRKVKEQYVDWHHMTVQEHRAIREHGE